MSTRAQSARYLREDLKRLFPDTKFKVSCPKSTYNERIDVEWTDGPTRERVQNALNQYHGWIHLSRELSDEFIDLIVKHFNFAPGSIVQYYELQSEVYRKSQEIDRSFFDPKPEPKHDLDNDYWWQFDTNHYGWYSNSYNPNGWECTWSKLYRCPDKECEP